MKDISKIDYSVLDRPEVLTYLFHPRPEPRRSILDPEPETEELIPPDKDVLIEVASEVVVGGRFHMFEKSACNILFFHGNGEIVADYDELGAIYNDIGTNFLCVDYRGYGRSTGKPTVTSMMQDSHIILDFTLDWLQRRNYIGPLVVMGRSLGSAPALELAASYPDQIAGLIVESGFAYASPLLALLGINTSAFGFSEEIGFRNVDKIAAYGGPTLVIHAENDHIIPFSEGRHLFAASCSEQKVFLKIPGANHNDIHYRGLEAYMNSIKRLSHDLRKNAS